jgi:DNA-binding phage protein
LKGDEESQQLFFIALRNVAEAQGGVGALAKKAHVGRESLYKALFWISFSHEASVRSFQL